MQQIFEVYIYFEAGTQHLGFVDFGYRQKSSQLCQFATVILLCLTYVRAHLGSPYKVIFLYVMLTTILRNGPLVSRSQLRLEHVPDASFWKLKDTRVAAQYKWITGQTLLLDNSRNAAYIPI